MISFIIPVKELNDLLYKTICQYKNNLIYEYEIIIVYDLCTTSVYNKFYNRFIDDESIVLLLNNLEGRINAINYGYTYANGDIIKCIDSDDIILNTYFECIKVLKNYPVHCHNAYLINNIDDIIGTYVFDYNIIFNNYEYVLTNLKSPPRWVWSFNREIAENIFPIPPELFAEDIWFSLIIKKNCKHIYHINECVYLYRQHSEGEWGGIKKFSPNVMSCRAKWILSLIPVLLRYREKLGILSDDVFKNVVNYYKVLQDNRSISRIMFAETNKYYKTKLFIIMYFPSIASLLLSLKWFVSKWVFKIKNYSI